MNTIKQKIKKGFDNGTFDAERGLTGWKDNGDHVWVHKTFDMWAVEGEAFTFARKGFKTFNGAINLFLKHVDGNNIDIPFTDTDDFINVIDIDTVDGVA